MENPKIKKKSAKRAQNFEKLPKNIDLPMGPKFYKTALL